MANLPIYLDNQSTTRVDPQVAQVMLEYMTERFGNAGSVSHVFGNEAEEAVTTARAVIANEIGAQPNEIVFTSGATESNNLAILGLARHRRTRGRRVLSVTTEHKAVLDPLRRLEADGWEVQRLVPAQQNSVRPGWLDPQQVADAIDDQTALVTVMLANNEIGTLQPLSAIAEICQRKGVAFHSDAAQALGKIDIDVDTLGLDLVSFSGHKLYGPKGVGALYVRGRERRIRLSPLMDGGGQERGLRSGTLNVPGIVGFAEAVKLAREYAAIERPRIQQLRDRLYEGIVREIPDVMLNGPPLTAQPPCRLSGNLNVCFRDVDGEALMLEMRDLAVSSGSACTAADPEPSHVLLGIGCDPDHVRSSLRFGIGRFNTVEDVDFSVDLLSRCVQKLRDLR